jgi:hypothetical protein
MRLTLLFLQYEHLCSHSEFSSYKIGSFFVLCFIAISGGGLQDYQ